MSRRWIRAVISLALVHALSACEKQENATPSSLPPATSSVERSPLAILGLSRGVPGHSWMVDGDRISVLDEGTANSAPDSIDDCYLVDYGADGDVDRVVDWEDQDRDGAADQMAIYTLTAESPGTVLLPEGTSIACWIVHQMDRDRHWWYLDRWQYKQESCQFRCDFSGDSYFLEAVWVVSQNRWASVFEAPFCFYDTDADGDSEEALRVEARDRTVRSIRWSFDNDNDAGRGESPYDYDLSVTARGMVEFGSELADTARLRGNPVQFLEYADARKFAASVSWNACLLAVDENDRNVDPEDPAHRERWEGVIASGVASFPQTGGPASGMLNKRYELGTHPRPIQLYWSPVDRRVHLLGADFGSIEVDANEDGKGDARLFIEDRDHNGYFDTWSYDADLQDGFEAVYSSSTSGEQIIALGWAPLSDAEGRSAEASGGLGQRERYFADVERWAATHGSASNRMKSNGHAGDWKP